MNKPEDSRTRFYVQWDTHARHMCTVLCSLMEHQSLVDLAICCGTNTIHAHKCVLAANSPYFREQLEKNVGTEQVVIVGIDFVIVKSIIEFMYCGETNILDENLKYMIAAAKLFQMRGLQTLVSDNQEIRYEADLIHIPAPLFLPRKPKYINSFRSMGNHVPSTSYNTIKSVPLNENYMHKKPKRKVRSEAEKACIKEAAASRLALEALQKELSTTTQTSSFIIEESCTETTVENFIPHTEETFINNLNHIETVPVQIVNYDELHNSILTTNEIINLKKSDCANKKFIPSNRDLKRLLAPDITGNVEIMFKTSEGNFVNVNDDDLLNLTGGTLQYQIVNENGVVQEVRELEVHQESNFDNSSVSLINPLQEANKVLSTNTDSNAINEENIDSFETTNNAVKDIEMAEIYDNDNSLICNEDSLKEDPIRIESDSKNSTFVTTNVNGSARFEVFNDSNENVEMLPNAPFIDYDVNHYLNFNNTDKPKSMNKNVQIQKSPLKESNEVFLKKKDDSNKIKLKTTEDINASEINNMVSEYFESKENQRAAANTNILPNIEIYKDGEVNNKGKRLKLTLSKLISPKYSIPSVDNEVPLEMFEDHKCFESGPLRKTKSNLKLGDDELCEEAVCNEEQIKSEKPRRIMSGRKKRSE